MPDLPVVLILAPQAVSLQSPETFNSAETRDFICRHYTSDQNLNAVLASERPDVIVSFGERGDYPRLDAAPLEMQRRRLHFESAALSEAGLKHIGAMILTLFLHRALAPKNDLIGGGGKPLVSVFTPAFRSGTRILRAYESLLGQTSANWEWVIVDDSDDAGATMQLLGKIAASEPRVSIYSSHRHSGKIGEVKRRACALAQGELLVELDHDDELTPGALAAVVQTFLDNPQAGFVYSDCAEVAEGSGESLTYCEGWAFGYGKYRTENYCGRELAVAIAPPLNSHTIRHIVGVPNHVRAWRRDVYWQLGGHNPNLHVADDYELLVRTFLHTEMRHIPQLCYIQYLHTGVNTQDARRSEIQRLVRCIGEYYEPQIRARLEEMGLPDHAVEKASPAII